MQERPLGCWESGFRSAHDMLAGTMLVVGCADLSCEFHLDKIKKGLYSLFKKHPLLQATIDTRGYNSFFVLNAQFDHIPIEILNKEVNWEKHFEDILHKPLDTQNYLWRIAVLENPTGFKLFFSTHHAIADALSQVSFIEQFMALYNNLLENNELSISPLALLPNVEMQLHRTNNWENFSNNYEKITQAKVNSIAYEAIKPIHDRTTVSKFITLRKDKLEKLLFKCKDKGVTLNSLLNATILKSQAILNPEFNSASLRTPVNLRQYCSPAISKEHLGCFLSIVETLHSHYDKDIWDLAREYEKSLKEAIPAIGFLPREIDYAEIDIALVASLFGVASAKRRRFLPNIFGVSNIGRLAIKTQYPKLVLNDYVFNTNHSVGNYYMFLSALTLDNHLRLIFSYVQPLVSENKAKRFINLFLENLELCC